MYMKICVDGKVYETTSFKGKNAEKASSDFFWIHKHQPDKEESGIIRFDLKDGSYLVLGEEAAKCAHYHFYDDQTDMVAAECPDKLGQEVDFLLSDTMV